MSTGMPSPFPATQWTAVVHLCRDGSPEARQAALERLCADYWYPLYVFARRQGHPRPDAEDLTQGFFHYLLERDLFSAASQELGKLRTFLLTVFQRYIGDVRGREQAQKRGGGKELLSLDVGYAESRYEAEPQDFATPVAYYDRSWAMSVLYAALHDLGEGERRSGRGEQFAVVETFLNPAAVAEGNYDAAAAKLGMSGEAVRKVVSRLRAKFRDCLRQQIAGTLHEPTPAQVDEELVALKSALRG